MTAEGEYTLSVPEFPPVLTTRAVSQALEERLESVEGSEILQYIVARNYLRSL